MAVEFNLDTIRFALQSSRKSKVGVTLQRPSADTSFQCLMLYETLI